MNFWERYEMAGYIPFHTQLYEWWTWYPHTSKIWKKFSTFRKLKARLAVLFTIITGFPEYYLVSHWIVPTGFEGKIRRAMYWNTKLYLWATGFNAKEEDDK